MTNDNDDKKKINYVIDLLTTKNVGKNVEFLLNNSYFLECPNILVDKNINLSKESITELKIKKINYQLNFVYNDKNLTILLSDHSSGSFDDGDYYSFYDLIIIYKGICVLVDKIDEEFKNYGSHYTKKYFFDSTLKKFKNGNWMDDLSFLVNSFNDHKEKQDLIKKEGELNKLSKNIDLDSLD